MSFWSLSSWIYFKVFCSRIWTQSRCSQLTKKHCLDHENSKTNTVSSMNLRLYLSCSPLYPWPSDSARHVATLHKCLLQWWVSGWMKSSRSQGKQICSVEHSLRRQGLGSDDHFNFILSSMLNPHAVFKADFWKTAFYSFQTHVIFWLCVCFGDRLLSESASFFQNNTLIHSLQRSDCRERSRCRRSWCCAQGRAKNPRLISCDL